MAEGEVSAGGDNEMDIMLANDVTLPGCLMLWSWTHAIVDEAVFCFNNVE